MLESPFLRRDRDPSQWTRPSTCLFFVYSFVRLLSCVDVIPRSDSLERSELRCARELGGSVPLSMTMIVCSRQRYVDAIISGAQLDGR